MSEQKLQAKILAWLKANGFWAFKVITANKSGIPDIIALTPQGILVGIEVKFGSNKTSKLQEWHLEQIRLRQGFSIVAYSLKDVVAVLGPLSVPPALLSPAGLPSDREDQEPGQPLL